MRPLLGLIVGVLIGAVGAVLFTQSLPEKEGSEAERAERVQFQLEKAEKEIALLKAKANPKNKRPSGRAMTEDIFERLRSGKRVSLDDVFNASMKPWLRDIAPLFDRMRVAGRKNSNDSIAGEMTRKYGLDDRQQDTLKKWLDEEAKKEERAFSEILESDSTGFIDFAMAMDDSENRRWGPDRGLDKFMAATLEGDALTEFQNDRMVERVERVQNEAEGKVQRLDSMVELDEDQKDQVFALMARSSNYFDPTMQFEGLEADSSRLNAGSDRNKAIREILSPDQQVTFDQAMSDRREDSLKEFHEMGLLPPKGWEAMEGIGF